MQRYLVLPVSVVFFTLTACTSTTTAQLTPSPQEPVCSPVASAVVWWKPQWRTDQKDVDAREAAAADGLRQFFQKSGCFKNAILERSPHASDEAATDFARRGERVILIAVRELGPTVRIGASRALVEGGTEVVLSISEFLPGRAAPRQFTVHWRNGGPGVLKGVASLPQDMQAALAAGLKPPAL